VLVSVALDGKEVDVLRLGLDQKTNLALFSLGDKVLAKLVDPAELIN
jgi:hypothetical protein